MLTFCDGSRVRSVNPVSWVSENGTSSGLLAELIVFKTLLGLQFITDSRWCEISFCRKLWSKGESVDNGESAWFKFLNSCQMKTKGKIFVFCSFVSFLFGPIYMYIYCETTVPFLLRGLSEKRSEVLSFFSFQTHPFKDFKLFSFFWLRLLRSGNMAF